jgi:glycosyltransferase involved in cell wall biosynthesis
VRILYHHRTLADGAEGIHIVEMVRAFRALGHEVWVLGGEPETGNDLREPPRPSTLAGHVRRLLPDAGVELAATAWNLPEYVAMRRAITAFSPAFVYQRHARFGLGAAMAARQAGIPVALEVNCLYSTGAYHGFEPLAFQRLARALERRVLQAATCRFAVSSPLATQVAELCGAQAEVLPNGADPDRFNPDVVSGEAVRTRLGLAGKVVVGWVGILRAWHGLELLLDAVAKVPRVHLMLVGDGPARAAVEQQAAALAIRERVTVTGRVPHDQIAEYIAAMDVAVVADERTGVASPMKLLEYMAMARAVLAPDLPNIRDLVRDDSTGLLFLPADAASLAHAIGRLSADGALRTRLGAAARQSIVHRLNWRANAAAVVEGMARSHVGQAGSR